jgi:pimeloyl-ACP methyl ester carboxylesterase
VSVAPSARPRTRYARTAGGFNIAYQVVGDGAVDVVLSPGAWTHLDLSWDVPPLAAFLERLASRCRLILFDKRGTGLSDRPPPTAVPSVDERIDDVVAVMDAARSTKAVLFGTLGGGAVAGTFAATYPDRALGLILFGTFGKLEPDTGLLSRIADSEEIALQRIEREWGSESVTLAFWAPSIMDDDDLKELVLRLARSALSPGSARTLFEMGFRVDWESLLPSIDTPTLVLHRTGDLVVPIRQGRTLAEQIPGARFVELPGMDHLIWAGDQEPLFREVDAFLAEVEPHARAERGLRAVLFTDIVGSTETAARLGDAAWRELLDRHHRLVRECLAAHGGREIDTAGDGFFASFERSAPAITCAMSITRDVRELGLEIRAGVHTGECELVAGKPTGIAVVIGARVAAMAGAGEVLATLTVKDLVAGSGIAFEDRGAHELKGVPGTWDVFRVIAEEPAASGA